MVTGVSITVDIEERLVMATRIVDPVTQRHVHRAARGARREGACGLRRGGGRAATSHESPALLGDPRIDVFAAVLPLASPAISERCSARPGT